MGRRGSRLLLASTLLAGAIAAACSSGHAAAPDQSDVQRLLAAHAHAVLTGNTTAAAADLDPGSAATAFRDRQGAALDALHQLPLQAWSYAVEAPVTDDPAVATATHRYGTAATIVHLSLRYQLRGVDAVPVSRELWWTFVTRDGHTRIAGDDDLAASGGVSWRGPWDFGPIVVRRSPTSLVIAPPADASQLAALSDLAAHAVGVVAAAWGDGWPRQITVVVPAEPSEGAALGAGGSGTTDVAAETVGGQRDPASGRVSGLFVVVNPSGYDRVDAAARARVFTHETTHVASADATADDTPRWLVEGLAEYVGRRGDTTPVPAAAPELAAAIRAGDPPSALPADAAFQAGGPGAVVAYEQAWLACRLIAARAGTGGLLALYRSVGTSPAGADEAVDTALGLVLHETTGAFTAQWLSELRAEFAT